MDIINLIFENENILKLFRTKIIRKKERLRFVVD